MLREMVATAEVELNKTEVNKTAKSQTFDIILYRRVVRPQYHLGFDARNPDICCLRITKV